MLIVPFLFVFGIMIGHLLSTKPFIALSNYQISEALVLFE